MATAPAMCCPCCTTGMSVGTTIGASRTAGVARSRRSLSKYVAAAPTARTTMMPSTSAKVSLSAPNVPRMYRCCVPCEAVKLCYALRRGVFYPSARDEFGTMPPRAERRRYLPLVKAMGFDAVEVGVDQTADASAARELASELEEHGLGVGCVRAGGGLCHPLAAEAALDKLQ